MNLWTEHDQQVTGRVESAAPWLNVFIDESGDANLNLAATNVSPLFIVAAVIVDDDQCQTATNAMAALAARLNSGSEIRSSRIGTNHQRRERFLQEIQSIDFGFVAMVVNKRRIDPESGLRFKRSFHKYVHRILQQRLADYGGGLRVFADEHGTNEFMEGFSRYLNERIAPSLFYGYEQEFVSSAETPLVQLADLIAGSLSYCFDGAKRCDLTPVFRTALREKQIDIAAWPPVEPVDVPPDSGTGPETAWDERIAAMAQNRCLQFLETHGDDGNEAVRMQCATLEMLLFASLHEEGVERSVFSAELLERLSARGLEPQSEQAFRSNVIGRLRDTGIVIAGNSQGYRLALSTEDIADYLGHSQGILQPMLSRVSTARRAVLQDTASRYDILSPGRYSVLRALVDEFGNAGVDLAAGGAGQIAAEEADEEYS